MDLYIMLRDATILHEERVTKALEQAKWARAIDARSDRQASLWSRAMRRLATLTHQPDRRELEEKTAV